MNNIQLLGRLAKTPEIKYTSNGKQYSWFTVAVSRQSKKDEVDFIRCVVFGSIAEALVKYCQKGRQVLVQGRLEVNTLQDKATGEYKTHHQVVAQQVNFLHDPNQQRMA